MNNSNSSDYLTIRDISEYLNVSLSKAYQISHRKDFPVCRLGGSIRIPRAAFLRWVECNTRIPEALTVA